MTRADSAWLKLERAVEHIEAVEALAEQWLNGPDFAIVSTSDAATGLTTSRARIAAAPPPRIGVVSGDAAHCLRTALDHSIYWLAEQQLGQLPPEVAADLMFPIVGWENNRGKPVVDPPGSFRNAAVRQLHGVPDRAVRFIEGEQPYHWEKAGDGFRFHWLWTVHELDRVDKHRRLATTAAALNFQYVGVPGGVDATIDFHVGEGLVKDGDELVTYSHVDRGVAPSFERAVAFDEPGLGRSPRTDVGRTLRTLLQRVEWIVSVLNESD